MHDFYRQVSHLFCCVPFHRRSDEHTASSLSTLQIPPSTLSIPLPHDTIPHSSSQSHLNDAKALHHIFSSSSSIRGYQTAATTPAYLPTARPSFDREFRFGTASPSKPPRTPIEKLGHHIRQRFSESRLSKASSKQGRASPDAGVPSFKQPSPLKEESDSPLGNSQSTAGLTEILASKHASQGGYDSDAHTIGSPLLRSQAGTIKVSTGFVKQTLEKFEFGNESAATAPPPCPVPCDGHVSPPLRDSSGHTRVQSSPFPTTPSKTSFAAALQVGNNESPTDVLRRLSAGIANGTIKAPNTPELKALRMPSINEVESHWRLTAPERTSSLTKLDQELQTKLKRLSDRFESAKRDSMISVDRDDKRTSLISELDPALIDYMSRYADRISSEEAHGHDLVEEAAVGRDDEIIEPLTSQDPSIHSQIKDETFSRPDIYSLAETDSDSVHLFNMRISQRLASQSRVPLQSPNTSNNASTWSVAVDSAANLEACGQGSVSNLTRYPTWIAPEHNRRPSDPQTKMLFERGTQQGKANAHTWKTITSVNSGSTSFDPKTKFTRMGKDDSSSFYQSDAELARSQVSSPIDRSRRSSFQNPHSLAVG
jgi:hypothetical protein